MRRTLVNIQWVLITDIVLRSLYVQVICQLISWRVRIWMQVASLQSLSPSYSLHSTNSQSKINALSTVKLVPKVEYTLIPLLFTQPELRGGGGQQSLPPPPPRMPLTGDCAIGPSSLWRRPLDNRAPSATRKYVSLLKSVQSFQANQISMWTKKFWNKGKRRRTLPHTFHSDGQLSNISNTFVFPPQKIL